MVGVGTKRRFIHKTALGLILRQMVFKQTIKGSTGVVKGGSAPRDALSKPAALRANVASSVNQRRALRSAAWPPRCCAKPVNATSSEPDVFLEMREPLRPISCDTRLEFVLELERADGPWCRARGRLFIAPRRRAPAQRRRHGTGRCRRARRQGRCSIVHSAAYERARMN